MLHRHCVIVGLTLITLATILTTLRTDQLDKENVIILLHTVWSQCIASFTSLQVYNELGYKLYYRSELLGFHH